MRVLNSIDIKHFPPYCQVLFENNVIIFITFNMNLFMKISTCVKSGAESFKLRFQR